MHLFSEAIKNLVQSKINEKKKMRRHPNESVVFSAPVWSTPSLSPRPRSVGGEGAKPSGLYEAAQRNEDIAEGSYHSSSMSDVDDTDRRRSASCELSPVTNYIADCHNDK